MRKKILFLGLIFFCFFLGFWDPTGEQNRLCATGIVHCEVFAQEDDPDLSFFTYSEQQIDTSIFCGDSIFLEGKWTHTPGIYRDTIQPLDSIVETRLQVLSFRPYPKDSSICVGDSIFFGGQYILSQGIYYDTIPVLGDCDSLIVLNLREIPLPKRPFQIDTTICKQDTMYLDAGDYADSYLWNDASSAQKLRIFEPKTYSVTLTQGKCSANYSVEVFFDSAMVSLGNDTVICERESIFLDAGDDNQFFAWSTGDSIQEIEVTLSGIYSVEVTTRHGCKATDSLELEVIQMPVLNLGEDTVMCPNAPFTIEVPGPYEEHLWHNLSILSSFYVADTGTFWIWVRNGICEANDTIQVSLCMPQMHPPNVFTPNGDGINDVFHPKLKHLKFYRMRIFNRWNNLVFETQDVDATWDGTQGGSPCPEGSYFYRIEYEGFDNKPSVKQGTIEVMR